MFENNDVQNDNNKESQNKKISFIGINNKYQIKKLIEEKKILKRKNIVISEEDLSFQFQEKTVNELFAKTYNNPLFVKEIKQKISNYKQQDVLKKIFNPLQFVSLDYIIQCLYECKMKCYYCSCEVYILYENVRENKQWTLDRIDNNQGHNCDNIVISCLECNLKRKNKNKNAFLFTKQLQITREMYTA